MKRKNMEEELIDVINENGEDIGGLDVSDIGIRWSFWDDNEKVHEDYNVDYTIEVESLFISLDENGKLIVMLKYDNGDVEPFNAICYEDEDGHNFGEYVYDEVMCYFD